MNKNTQCPLPVDGTELYYTKNGSMRHSPPDNRFWLVPTKWNHLTSGINLEQKQFLIWFNFLEFSNWRRLKSFNLLQNNFTEFKMSSILGISGLPYFFLNGNISLDQTDHRSVTEACCVQGQTDTLWKQTAHFSPRTHLSSTSVCPDTLKGITGSQGKQDIN